MNAKCSHQTGEGILCTESSSVPRSGALRIFHKRERDTEQGKTLCCLAVTLHTHQVRSHFSSSLAFVAAALTESSYSLMQKHFAGQIAAVISV